ncbi:MAG: hypothetical protein K0R57_277 [Paenibacillaceae bacterium]|nr:hypothetical protein [Paenibacillaceae bacterium]
MNKKGVFTGFICLTLASALTACGDGANNTDPAPSDSAKPSAGAAAASPTASAPVTLKIMANYDTPDISETDKKFVAQLEAHNNVKIQWEIPPVTGYKERVQLMLASGDYPDVVFFPGTSDASFQNALKDGIIIPVNDYLKTADYINKYTYQSEWDALKVNKDERIYGIPRTSVVRNDGFWVRKDWLDKLNISLPGDGKVTKDQFEDVLKQFTLNDPDGNGKKDTYGYAGVVNANKVFDPILTGAFGLVGWQKAAGGEYPYMNAMYDSSSTNFKDALAYTAKLYTGGYFDPDSATNDGTKQRERFWRGLTGVYPGFAGHYVWHLGELQKQNPQAELTYIWVKDDNGQVTSGNLAVGANGLWGFWGITKTAKNPQKAVDLLNSWLSDELWPIVTNGYEGTDYELKDGEKVSKANAPTNFYIRRNSMRRAYDPGFFTAGNPKQVIEKISPWLTTALETVKTPMDAGFLPEAAKKPDYQDYQKVWSQTVMKIIMGKESVAKFDELLAGWYKNGGLDYVKQMNDFISKLNPGK